MCGITGFNWEDEILIKEMTSVIKHRGPDQEGYFTDKNVSLGHKRLSIIDLSTNGKNPLFNEKEDMCIIFNGEIYNFQNLREELEKKGHQFKTDTDTEVIVHGFEEWGENVTTKLEGMFAFCIYNQKRKRLFLARDRLGIKPLYYYYQNKKFVFGSEIKSIAQIKEIKLSTDQKALTEFLLLGYNLGNKTGFAEIKQIIPGSQMIVDLKTQKIQTKTYWNIKKYQQSKRTNPEKEYKKLLEDAVKKRLISDVPLATLLSGGVDSSAITAIAAKIKKQEGLELNTYVIGDSEQNTNQDVMYATKVAEQLGTNHKIVPINKNAFGFLPLMIWHMDTPNANLNVLPTFLLSKEIKKKATVVLNGLGPDELLGAYQHHKINKQIRNRQIHTLLKPLNHEFIQEQLRKRLQKKYGQGSTLEKPKFKQKINSITTKDDAESWLLNISKFSKQEFNKLKQGKNYNKILNHLQTNYFVNKNTNQNITVLETKERISNEELHYIDRATMATQIEARVPFLDHKLVEFSLGLTSNQKFNNKKILKRIIKNDIPKEILKRKKQGFFIPSEDWLKKGLLEPIMERIQPATIKEYTGVDIQEQIKYIEKEFKHSPRYYSKQIMSFFILQLWLEQQFQDISPKEQAKTIFQMVY